MNFISETQNKQYYLLQGHACNLFQIGCRKNSLENIYLSHAMHVPSVILPQKMESLTFYVSFKHEGKDSKHQWLLFLTKTTFS